MPFWVLQFVLFGGLPRAILRAPVRALWRVASCHFACSSSCFVVGCLMPLCVLQFVLFGGLPRATLRAPVRAFWWVASCHFGCSSLCFLVGCLVPFCVLQFVLCGGLPRATLRVPVRALWWVASCHFACSSSCFLVGCLVPLCVLQFVLFGGLPRAILGASSLCFLVGCLVPLCVPLWKMFVRLVEGIQSNRHSLAAGINSGAQVFMGIFGCTMMLLVSLAPVNERIFLRTQRITPAQTTTLTITAIHFTVRIPLAKLRSEKIRHLYIRSCADGGIRSRFSRSHSSSTHEQRCFKAAAEDSLLRLVVELGLHEANSQQPPSLDRTSSTLTSALPRSKYCGNTHSSRSPKFP